MRSASFILFCYEFNYPTASIGNYFEDHLITFSCKNNSWFQLLTCDFQYKPIKHLVEERIITSIHNGINN